MRLRHTLSTALLFAAFATSVHASSEEAVEKEMENALTISFRDGTSTSFFLADKPTATFVGDSLKVTSDNLSVSYLRSDIVECFFEKLDKNADELQKPENNRLFCTFVDNGLLRFKGLQKGSIISIYDTKGLPCKSQQVADGQEETFVEITELPSGIYLIKITNQPTIKIIKR